MTSLNDTLGKLSASIIVFWDGHVMKVGEDVVDTYQWYDKPE